MLQQFAQDARYALRGIRRQPGFSAAAIFMLTVGLGLLAGGYTVFNGLFLRGWAVPENDRVFRVSVEPATGPGQELPAAGPLRTGISVGEFAYVRAGARAADYVATSLVYFNVKAEPAAHGLHSAGFFASDNLVQTLRIPLQMGRGLRTGETAVPELVISDRVWRTELGAASDIVGKTVWLGSKSVPVTVVGVIADGFDGLGPDRLDLLVDIRMRAPFGTPSGAQLGTGDAACCVGVAGRMRDGWTRSQVREELEVLTGQYRRSLQQPAIAVGVRTTAVGDGLRESRRDRWFVPVLMLIGAGIVLVMLLTCANVGNLFLAKSLRRQHEIAVRLSLGASRARIVRQLVTEGFVLAALAGTGAFVVTMGVPVLLWLIEDNVTATMFASDWRVAAFTAAGVVVTCLVVSLTPALQTTKIAWRGTAITVSPQTGRTRSVLLAVQIAIAAVLVLSATLISRGVQASLSVQADFAFRTTTLVNIYGRSDNARRAESVQSAIQLLQTQKGLAIGMGDTVVASRGLNSLNAVVRGGPSRLTLDAQLLPLSTPALQILEVKLARGRWAADQIAAREVVVNETLARRMWPNGDAIGSTLDLLYDHQTYTIVGITRDAHLTSLFGDVRPLVHTAPLGVLPGLFVRSSPDDLARVRALVSSVDPGLAVSFTPLTDSMTQTAQNALIGVAIAGGLGVVALVLAIVGVFGVFSYLVEERRREIGIRLALGATRRQIRSALLETTRGAMVGGVAGGLVLSAIAGTALRGFLFGLSPADPVSYLVVGAVLTFAALAAMAIPLRRALRVDPAVTLRSE